MTERPEALDVARQWVEKAEHDLLNIENNLAASKVPWDTVCFHAQQCAEKYLKALLTFRGIEFPKSHDLTELLPLLPSSARPGIDPALLEELNPYAIETRYPGAWEAPGRDEALRAVEGAKKIRSAARALLPGQVLGGEDRR